MLSLTAAKIINKVLHICHNNTKPVALSTIHVSRRYFSEEHKMSEPVWLNEKTRRLQKSTAERRQGYSKEEVTTVNMIDPWCNYRIRHKEIEKKKHTLDDLEEFKTIRINNSLNRSMAQRVSLFKGDITKLETSAIVNAANKLLRAGGGVDGAIHRAAGRYLQEECNTLGGCQTGQAKITGGYNLPARYVIHTVGPQDGSATKLQECYTNSLSFSKEYKLTSIAFPCISTGIYGFPSRLAAHVALRATRLYLEKHEDVERVIFCVFMPIDVEIYETLMQMYFPVHDWDNLEYTDRSTETD